LFTAQKIGGKNLGGWGLVRDSGERGEEGAELNGREWMGEPADC